MVEIIRTYGGEVEKPVSNLEAGTPHAVSQTYFNRLVVDARRRGQEPSFHHSDTQPNTILGVTTDDLGDQGIDNGGNLLETALPVTHSLEELNHRMDIDLRTVEEALKSEGATVINMSVHPLGSTSLESYRAYVAPKGIYKYLWHRGWDHSAGIDAKAQNSPATGVSAYEAAEAVSVMIGLGAANIALFGNSPVAEGKVTGSKESRLLMWDRMMANATVEGDRITAQFPDQRFNTLKDYFDWMFGGQTGIHFIKSGNGADYKTAGALVTVDGNPSVLNYLNRQEWTGTVLGTDDKVSVHPQLSHMQAMQFAQFAGARVRWGFKDQATIEEFLEAMRTNTVEAYFARATNFVYIEGRDPGANFPDKELSEKGDNIRNSVVIAPSAIQAGVINNLHDAARLVSSYSWKTLAALRVAAIKDGLQGEVMGVSVRKFTEQALEVASRGLSNDQQWMLAYPSDVIRTSQNGADRFLQNLGDNSDRSTIARAVVDRNVSLT